MAMRQYNITQHIAESVSRANWHEYIAPCILVPPCSLLHSPPSCSRYPSGGDLSIARLSMLLRTDSRISNECCHRGTAGDAAPLRRGSISKGPEAEVPPLSSPLDISAASPSPRPSMAHPALKSLPSAQIPYQISCTKRFYQPKALQGSKGPRLALHPTQHAGFLGCARNIFVTVLRSTCLFIL